MKRVCAIALALVIATPAIGFAHGTVGDYTFLEPIVADDANPKNEFDILHPRETWTAAGRQFSLGFSLEKVIVALTKVEAFFEAQIAKGGGHPDRAKPHPR